MHWEKEGCRCVSYSFPDLPDFGHIVEPLKGISHHNNKRWEKQQSTAHSCCHEIIQKGFVQPRLTSNISWSCKWQLKDALLAFCLKASGWLLTRQCIQWLQKLVACTPIEIIKACKILQEFPIWVYHPSIGNNIFQSTPGHLCCGGGAPWWSVDLSGHAAGRSDAFFWESFPGKRRWENENYSISTHPPVLVCYCLLHPSFLTGGFMWCPPFLSTVGLVNSHWQLAKSWACPKHSAWCGGSPQSFTFRQTI